MQTAGDCAGALEKLQAVARIKLTPARSVQHRAVRRTFGQAGGGAGSLSAGVGRCRGAIDQRRQRARSCRRSSRSKVASRGSSSFAAAGRLARASRSIATVLGDANIGSELRRDPGPHRIVAQIDGRQVFEDSFRLAEGEKREVVVDRRGCSPATTFRRKTRSSPAGGPTAPAKDMPAIRAARSASSQEALASRGWYRLRCFWCCGRTRSTSWKTAARASVAPSPPIRRSTAEGCTPGLPRAAPSWVWRG